MLAAILVQTARAQGSINDPPQSFRVLCYHDVRDRLRDSISEWPDPTAVDTRDLVLHFSWLKASGYHPVSLQQIVDARTSGAPLPDKAVLLTFDDGYQSMYTTVFPLLKQFEFPALVAIVGEWISTPEGELVAYGGDRLPRSRFVNWEELREMRDSGLVEVASHSFALHRGVLANPQGNSIPAAVTRQYVPATGRYESDAEYADRISQDLRRSADQIERELGARPRAMVWPYGAYNMEGIQWAADAGMPITLTLDSGPNTPSQPLGRIRRSLAGYSMSLTGLAQQLREPGAEDNSLSRERVVHVDLDYVYDSDPVVQERNLSALLDRIVRLHPTTVYLQAYSDPDGDGVADALYFPNRHMPMRADLFSRAAWQLRTRAHVDVYAWMPVLAFDLPVTHPAGQHRVTASAGGQGAYRRLSPFSPLVRKTVAEIYEDLGKHAMFSGVLFHDDAMLSDAEDSSPDAIRVYREEWGLPGSIATIRGDARLRQQWARRKTDYLIAFTQELASVLRHYHPGLRTSRNLYARPVLQPASEEWYAQSLPQFLANYDFVAVMAMPLLENASDPDAWLDRLVAEVKAIPDGLARTVFELQSRDWRSGTPVSGATLAAQWRRLHLAGARHWGYYPDDFHANQPDETLIKPAISVETFPSRR